MCNATTGFEQNDLLSTDIGINIYPNPANGILNILINGNIESKNMALEIINSIGQIILKEQFKISQNRFSKQINTATFPKGLYFIKLRTKDNMIVRKFIVQ